MQQPPSLAWDFRAHDDATLPSSLDNTEYSTLKDRRKSWSITRYGTPPDIVRVPVDTIPK